MMSVKNKYARKGHPKLTPASMTEWRERMGYTKIDAAFELGLSRNSITNYENGFHKIPKSVGLAMSALMMGMKPYGR